MHTIRKVRKRETRTGESLANYATFVINIIIIIIILDLDAAIAIAFHRNGSSPYRARCARSICANSQCDIPAQKSGESVMRMRSCNCIVSLSSSAFCTCS